MLICFDRLSKDLIFNQFDIPLCPNFSHLEFITYFHLNVYSMQLYNTLSAEERAQLIDEAGKQRLHYLSMRMPKIEDPKKFRDDLFIEWNKLDALWSNLCSQRRYQCSNECSSRKF